MEKEPMSGWRESFSARLLAWHAQHKRDFSWRRTDSPYKILIAEILLQRTKAEQVEPVFRKFVRRYPTARALARADTKEIECCIESLGLRKRGKMLKQLAGELAEKHGGEVPATADALLALKGVGHYVANAVLCFAYGEDAPIVDWNVGRVVGRVWRRAMKQAPHTNKKLFAFMSQLIPRGRGREFNLALLDFSALVCKPRFPECGTCPIGRECRFRKGKTAQRSS